MVQKDRKTVIRGTPDTRKRRPYSTQVAGVLAAAFALSLAYSAIVTVTGSHEGYGLGDPTLWVFYAVGFALAALALADRGWAWWVVAVAVLVLIAVGIFYYPTIFPPSAQTTLAWFENDVYMGLLILAEYLCVQRLRNVDVTAETWESRTNPRTRGSERMSRAGDVFENPVTGERVVVRVGSEESGGDLLVADLYVRPGGAVAGEHVHVRIEEWFTVRKGRVGFRLDGRETVAPHDERMHVPAGTAHGWWNAGEEEAHLVVEVALGARFEAMIKNLYGLAQDGKTDAKGMPNLLQAALFAREFDDVLRFTKPPRPVQKVLFAALGPIARFLGYRGSYPEYLERGPLRRVEVDPRAGSVEAWSTMSVERHDGRLSTVTEERANEVGTLVAKLDGWARGRPEVVAVGLVGSWARGGARMDSDLDVVLLAEDREPFVRDEAWVHALGGTDVVRTCGWGPVTERRFVLPSGFEVELGVAPPTWAATDPVDGGTRRVVTDGMSIVYDPKGLLARLMHACGRPEKVESTGVDDARPGRTD